MDVKARAMASLIDHTLLKPTAIREEIEKLCKEAMDYHFHSVCINPYYVNLTTQLLKDSTVKVCTVVGFPLGANTILQKAKETGECLLNGAQEIDMVIALAAIKAGDWEYVKEELKILRQLTHGKAILKVIMEIALLEEHELKRACITAKDVGVDFVKTSTGFLGEGATVDGVALMKKTVGEQVGVKASGGIRTWQQMDAMLKAGANRIGTSSGVAIIKEFLSLEG